MACGATSNLDYPDYIKEMLKIINAENDNTLKSCACSLRSPLTDEGCPVVDEDGKVGLFPFCVTQGGQVGNNTSNPVGMPLKDVMTLYWKPKTFRIVEDWHTRWGNGDQYDATVNGSTNVTLSTGKTKMSEALCPPFDTIIAGNAGTFTKKNPAATPPFTGPVTDTLILQLFIGEPYIIYQNGLYYPNVTFYRDAEENQYWEWNSIGGGGIVEPFYMAELKINSHSYTFQMYSTAAGAAISTNCSSVITIDEERNTA
jgi:hypothetical protein